MDKLEPAHEPCAFPGLAAPKCPGYDPAPVARLPEHLRYLTFLSDSEAQTGCAHLVADRTPRGGFRSGCAHPAGCPAHWTESEVTGRPVRIRPPRPVVVR